MANVIEAEGLVKRYKEVTALAGLDLAVPAGTVFGLLGPNGAGKTTAVSILSTLITPDEGRATVAGIDLISNPRQVRKQIGLSGQNAAVDETLTGYENLEMIGRLYRLGRSRSRTRARELLEQLNLTDAADRPVKTYSGGMRRRLDLAGALVAQAPVLFLDEPTTGLDPRSRIDLWQIIGELVRSGTTLLLTTQYLDEADQLADRILVIDHGRAIAEGTPEELKEMVGGERIEVTVLDAAQAAQAQLTLADLAVGEIRTDGRPETLLVPIAGGAPVLTQALRKLDVAGIEIRDVMLRRPTLDDAFLSLTGHGAESLVDTPDYQSNRTGEVTS